jgi:hypothetical protein
VSNVNWKKVVAIGFLTIALLLVAGLVLKLGLWLVKIFVAMAITWFLCDKLKIKAGLLRVLFWIVVGGGLIASFFTWFKSAFEAIIWGIIMIASLIYAFLIYRKASRAPTNTVK